MVELVAVGPGRHARKAHRHLPVDTRRTAGEVRKAVAATVLDGRNVDLDLHARDIEQQEKRRPGIDHLRRREVHLLDIAVGRSVELRIVEFVAVGLQLYAQLPQPGAGLLEVIGRDALLLEKLLRAFDLILELVVLDLQRLDRQPVVGVVEFGEQLSAPHVITLLHVNPGNLSGRLESQVHLVGRTDDARKGADCFAAQKLGPRQAHPLYVGFVGRTPRTAARQGCNQCKPDALYCCLHCHHF